MAVGVIFVKKNTMTDKQLLDYANLHLLENPRAAPSSPNETLSITHPSDWQNLIRRAAVFVWSLASESWVFYTFDDVSVALDSGWQEEDGTLLSLDWQLK